MHVYLLPKCEVNIQSSPPQVAGERLGVGEHLESLAWRYGELGLHWKRCRPGYEGSAERRAPAGGVVLARIRGNDALARCRRKDERVAEVGKRTPHIQIIGRSDP